MLVKFFKHGTKKTGNTSAKSVKNYLLNERAEQGTARVIKGDEPYTSQLIDELNAMQNSSTYTAGCLSFSENEKLSDEQKQELMQSFESALLPDFDTDRYASYWVEHSDKGRLELNFVFAKIDLQTGKHLDVFQKQRDVKRLNAWKEIQIQQYDLDDPNDPKHRRLKNDFYKVRDDGKDEKTEKRELIEALDDYIETNILANKISTSSDVKKFLEFLNGDETAPTGIKVVKQTKQGASIENDGKPMRLRGYYYGKDFNLSTGDPSHKNRIEADRAVRQAQYERDRTERLNRANTEFIDLSRKRGAELDKKYGRDTHRSSSHNHQHTDSSRPITAHATINPRDDRDGRERQIIEVNNRSQSSIDRHHQQLRVPDKYRKKPTDDSQRAIQDSETKLHDCRSWLPSHDIQASGHNPSPYNTRLGADIDGARPRDFDLAKLTDSISQSGARLGTGIERIRGYLAEQEAERERHNRPTFKP